MAVIDRRIVPRIRNSVLDQIADAASGETDGRQFGICHERRGLRHSTTPPVMFDSGNHPVNAPTRAGPIRSRTLRTKSTRRNSGVPFKQIPNSLVCVRVDRHERIPNS